MVQLPPAAADQYKPSAELLAAINTALFLQRPLLLSGEPGTGKTLCADFIARQLHARYPDQFKAKKAIRFNTKSVSQSTDLFFSYDAVAHFGDKTNRPKESFIALNSLGIAILGSHTSRESWGRFFNYEKEVQSLSPPFASVVLIDELDKAPRDFPNDLLAELEKPPFTFSIKELVNFEVKQNPEFPVFIVLTSNNEKNLPDAFLRRCVFHYIKFPEEKELVEIVKSNLTLEGDDGPVRTAIAKFMELRKNNISKKPATSELVDWIACLQYRKLLNENLSDWKAADPQYKQQVRETLGVLAKTKTDIEILNQEIGR